MDKNREKPSVKLILCAISIFAISQPYLMALITLLPETSEKKHRSWTLNSRFLQTGGDRAVVAVVARNVKLAIRGSQQL